MNDPDLNGLQGETMERIMENCCDISCLQETNFICHFHLILITTYIILTFIGIQRIGTNPMFMWQKCLEFHLVEQQCICMYTSISFEIALVSCMSRLEIECSSIKQNKFHKCEFNVILFYLNQYGFIKLQYVQDNLASSLNGAQTHHQYQLLYYVDDAKIFLQGQVASSTHSFWLTSLGNTAYGGLMLIYTKCANVIVATYFCTFFYLCIWVFNKELVFFLLITTTKAYVLYMFYKRTGNNVYFSFLRILATQDTVIEWEGKERLMENVSTWLDVFNMSNEYGEVMNGDCYELCLFSIVCISLHIYQNTLIMPLDQLIWHTAVVLFLLWNRRVLLQNPLILRAARVHNHKTIEVFKLSSVSSGGVQNDHFIF
ncbi:hypothetical protein ACJX0J_019348, partial [Zea mays]